MVVNTRPLLHFEEIKWLLTIIEIHSFVCTGYQTPQKHLLRQIVLYSTTHQTRIHELFNKLCLHTNQDPNYC